MGNEATASCQLDVHRDEVVAAYPQAACRLAAEATVPPPTEPLAGLDEMPAQWLVLVTCRDEQHQLEVLHRFQKDGLACKALVS